MTYDDGDIQINATAVNPTRITGDFPRYPLVLLHTNETKFDSGTADAEAATSASLPGKPKEGKTTKRGRKPNTRDNVSDGTLPVDPTVSEVIVVP